MILLLQPMTMGNFVSAQTQPNVLTKHGILLIDNICIDEVFPMKIVWNLDESYDNQRVMILYSATHSSGLTFENRGAYFDLNNLHGHSDIFETDLRGQWTFEVDKVTDEHGKNLHYDGLDSKVYITIPPCDNPLDFIENNTNNITLDTEIPSWIKQAGDFWVQGQTTDREFASSIAYLVRSDIIPVSDMDVDLNGDIVIDENMQLPDWIKNTITWWVSGAISDSEFQSGIKFLLEEKIINFKEAEPIGSIMDEGIDFDVLIINKHGLWNDYDSDLCNGGIIMVQWTTKTLGDLSVLVTNPMGSSFVISILQNNDSFYSTAHESTIPGTWKFDLMDVPMSEINRGVVYHEIDSLIPSSTIYVTHPPCDEESDSEIGIEPSSNSITDHLLDVSPLSIADKKITSCTGDEVIGEFEFRRENGDNVGFDNNSRVKLILENMDTGEQTTSLYEGTSGDNFVEFIAYLSEGTWKIYPEWVIIVPTPDMDEWNWNDPELLEVQISNYEMHLDRILVSGESLTVEIPCNVVIDDQTNEIGIENDSSTQTDGTIEVLNLGGLFYPKVQFWEMTFEYVCNGTTHYQTEYGSVYDIDTLNGVSIGELTNGDGSCGFGTVDSLPTQYVDMTSAQIEQFTQFTSLIP